MDSYDIHINELRCDEEQNPFKIGSIKVTYGLLESGVLGVASIAAAVISKFFSTKVSTNWANIYIIYSSNLSQSPHYHLKTATFPF